MHLFRLLRIIYLFAYYAQPIAQRKKGYGARLAKSLYRMGPAYIKLGQALSIRQDILGEEIANELGVLRDSLPPFAFRKVKTIIERELGRPLHELYESFDEEAVAAASIAQVHFAVTPEGKEVAVKVLRPDVDKVFGRDIAMMRWLARSAERLSKEARRLKLREVVEEFARSAALELDLRMEAAAASELKENFAGQKGFHVPAVDWRRTAERVMTMERIDGIPINERERLLAAGHDLNLILNRSWEFFFKQIFRDGFFHADMHPGNVFIDREGNIAVVDFGIMGRLSTESRYYLAEMIRGFVRRDYTRVAEVHFEAGYVPDTKSVALFAQALRSVTEPIFGLPQSEISVARLLSQLFKITRQFEMQTQPQLLMLQKTLMMAEGMARTLDPNVNIWNLASPHVESWTRSELGVEGRLRHAAEEIKAFIARVSRLLDLWEESLKNQEKC